MIQSQTETAYKPDPLSMPGIVRILLGPTASRILTETGERCFALASRDSYPGDPSRWIIYLQPVPLKVACDACRILDGSHRAQRVKVPAVATAKPSQAALPANMPDRRPDAAPANLDASPDIAT